MTESGASPVPGQAPISLPRLAVAFALCAVAITRLSLVLHEFVGHGGFVVAIGSELDDFRLFLFGGGWVRFSRVEPYSVLEQHMIAISGVVLELAVGATLLWCSRWLRVGSPLRVLVVAWGAIDILHGLVYAVNGTHYGFGDGRMLHHALGPARPLAVAAGTLVLGGLGYVFGRWFARELTGWLEGMSARRAFVSIAAAASLAGGLHLGLMLAEQAVVDDPTYARIMTHQSVRLVERDLRLQTSSRELSAAQIRALRAQLERRHRPFPVRPFVYGFIAIGVIAGAWRSLARDRLPVNASAPTWIGLSPLALICGLSLVLVLLLRSPWWR